MMYALTDWLVLGMCLELLSFAGAYSLPPGSDPPHGGSENGGDERRAAPVASFSLDGVSSAAGCCT